MPLNITLRFTKDHDEIKHECAVLVEQMQLRRAELEMLSVALAHYQKLCTHPGQVTGYNERDGSWGNPCPICGYSY